MRLFLRNNKMAFIKSTVAAAGLAVLANVAQAQQQTCLSRDEIVSKLDTRYNEHPIGRGLQGEARLFEVFMSQDGSSWTIIQSYPNGLSCIMAAGTHWHQSDLAAVFGTSS